MCKEQDIDHREETLETMNPEMEEETTDGRGDDEEDS